MTNVVGKAAFPPVDELCSLNLDESDCAGYVVIGAIKPPWVPWLLKLSCCEYLDELPIGWITGIIAGEPPDNVDDDEKRSLKLDDGDGAV